jgi:hypothetical protein
MNIQDIIQALQAAAGEFDNSEFGFVKSQDNSSVKFLFVSREHVGDVCWYMLDDNSRPTACPTTSLRGRLKSIYQIDTVRGNRGQYKSTKMRLTIEAGAQTYVLENGADTVLSQSIASSILFGNVQLGDIITIQVAPADQSDKVVFASVLDVSGNKIIAPKEFNRAGAVSAAQQHLGCVVPEKKEYDKPYGAPAPTGLSPVAVKRTVPSNDVDTQPDYDDIPF